MLRYRELAGSQIFRCAECGRRKRVKYVPASNLCRSCAAKKRRTVPNVPVKITENLVITKVVEKRLRKKAESAIPRERIDIVGEFIERFILIPFWVSAPFVANNLFDQFSGMWWIFVLGWCLLIPYVVYLLINRILAKPRRERMQRVTSMLNELAEKRKERLEEQERFYSSPEWAAIRKQVIDEEGPVCGECGRQIIDSNNITVDHKYPRSKYPALALRRDNLRVLCRECNSRKRDKEWLEI